ncbi:hypothetical protein Bbelb_168690 [Branchiostoma belcheri]|nr:hypothetical protein Bbelb_168690 [Branchiostoma belcheri]
MLFKPPSRGTLQGRATLGPGGPEPRTGGQDRRQRQSDLGRSTVGPGRCEIEAGEPHRRGGSLMMEVRTAGPGEPRPRGVRAVTGRRPGRPAGLQNQRSRPNECACVMRSTWDIEAWRWRGQLPPRHPIPEERPVRVITQTGTPEATPSSPDTLRLRTATRRRGGAQLGTTTCSVRRESETETAREKVTEKTVPAHRLPCVRNGNACVLLLTQDDVQQLLDGLLTEVYAELAEIQVHLAGLEVLAQRQAARPGQRPLGAGGGRTARHWDASRTARTTATDWVGGKMHIVDCTIVLQAILEVAGNLSLHQTNTPGSVKFSQIGGMSAERQEPRRRTGMEEKFTSSTVIVLRVLLKVAGKP